MVNTPSNEKKYHRSWILSGGNASELEDSPEDAFPIDVVDELILRHTKRGDWILDPFAGWGTVSYRAEQLGRHVLGIEIDHRRCTAAQSRYTSGRQIHGDSRISVGGVEHQCSLVLTSPPFFLPECTLSNATRTSALLAEALRAQRHLLSIGATVVVEGAAVVGSDGMTIPLHYLIYRELSQTLTYRGEIVRCCLDGQGSLGGFDHSYFLCFGT